MAHPRYQDGIGEPTGGKEEVVVTDRRRRRRRNDIFKCRYEEIFLPNPRFVKCPLK